MAGFSKQEADLAEVQEARERLGSSGFERAGGVLPQGRQMRWLWGMGWDAWWAWSV